MSRRSGWVMPVPMRAWTHSSGNTRTTVNFAKATFQALKKTTEARVPQRTREKREVIESILADAKLPDFGDPF